MRASQTGGARARQLCVLVGAAAAVHIWMTLLSVHSTDASSEYISVATLPSDLTLHDMLTSQQLHGPRRTPVQVAAQAHALHEPEAHDLSSSLPPPPLPPLSPPSATIDRCYTAPHTEYDGPVVIWGSNTVLGSAAECCATCRKHREDHSQHQCMYWVFCGAEGGCNTQKQGECWGKARASSSEIRPQTRGSGDRCLWTSGAVFTEEEASAMRRAEEREASIRAKRRDRPGNPRVYLEVDISRNANAPLSSLPTRGRIEFVLYAHESPRAAENFRAMCTGERGGKLSFKGMRFYRILDMFIDQAGVHGAASIWGGSFDDDPGGLALKHDKPGLLSAANSGPDTNSGHFSIVVAPAPHLNSDYTVFGEVVAGMNLVMAVNALAPPSGASLGSAVVSAAGCISNCAPRHDVSPKCRQREVTPRKVQGRSMHPCID